MFHQTLISMKVFSDTKSQNVHIVVLIEAIQITIQMAICIKGANSLETKSRLKISKPTIKLIEIQPYRVQLILKSI